MLRVDAAHFNNVSISFGDFGLFGSWAWEDGRWGMGGGVIIK